MMEIGSVVEIVAIAIAGVALAITGLAAVRIVPQAEEHVVERFGEYLRTLQPGLRLIVPVVDRVRARVSVLEHQLEAFKVSVITKDNVEVGLMATVFMRVTEADKSVYRIEHYESAVQTTATSLLRNEAGKFELDKLQASRDEMNQNVHEKLGEAAKVWGIRITRTEIVDVIVDDRTKEAQRQQLNAEREKRARVAEAEGEKRAVELAAEAKLFEARKEADAVRITADAHAYEIRTVASAQSEEIKVVGKAIRDNGEAAALFEIRKRQVSAMSEIAASENTKVVLVPAEVMGTLGAIEVIGQGIAAIKGTGAPAPVPAPTPAPATAQDTEEHT